jgi:hypothetical protein
MQHGRHGQVDHAHVVRDEALGVAGAIVAQRVESGGDDQGRGQPVRLAALSGDTRESVASPTAPTYQVRKRCTSRLVSP